MCMEWQVVTVLTCGSIGASSMITSRHSAQSSRWFSCRVSSTSRECPCSYFKVILMLRVYAIYERRRGAMLWINTCLLLIEFGILVYVVKREMHKLVRAFQHKWLSFVAR